MTTFRGGEVTDWAGRRDFRELTPTSKSGFTVVELISVMLVIAIVIGAAVLLWVNASRGADVNSVAVMISQDLTRVNALADSGTRTNDHKDRYRVCFEASGSPANTYKIEKFTYDNSTSAYIPATVPYEPEKGTYNRMEAGGWIKPSGSSDIRITPDFGSSGSRYITFISVGSMVRAVPTADYNTTIMQSGPMTITVLSTSNDITKTITLSNFGDVKIR